MKKLFQKKNSTENQKLFNFVEEELGEPLTKEQKAQVLKDSKATVKVDRKYRKSELNFNRVVVLRPQKGFFLRYGLTALACIIVCLSATLPFALKVSAKCIEIPVEIPVEVIVPPVFDRYKTGVPISVDETFMREEIDGLLLFGENQIFDLTEYGDVRYWGNSWMETIKSTLLGYVIDQSKIMINGSDIFDSDVFDINYRIRTYKNYAFAGYYDIFSAIENTYLENAGDIIDEEEIYAFVVNKIEDPDTEAVEDDTPITVNAFIVEDVKVFCYYRANLAGAYSLIYFNYGDYEYFIKVTQVDVPPTVEYIKNFFMPALLDQEL